MTKLEAEQYLEKIAHELGEHFEAVQIMASWHQNGATTCFKRGSGNWYSRQGMCHEFINQDEAQENAVAIAEKLNPPDDEWKKA